MKAEKQWWRVSLREPGDKKTVVTFDCQASNSEDAFDKAEDARPGHETLTAVEIDTPANPEPGNATTKIHVLFSYNHTYTPPRCRNPRTERRHDGNHVIEIPTLTAEQAPVALRSRDPEYSVEYRWWNNRLWTTREMRGVKPTGTEWPLLPSVVNLRDEGDAPCEVRDALGSRLRSDLQVMSEEKVEKALDEIANYHLLIDGKHYRPAGEPFYEVITFGLGGNHGGTACMLVTHSSNPESSFGLLERDAAIAKAHKIATERGDTKNLPIVPSGPDIEILLPQAIQVRTPAFTAADAKQVIGAVCNAFDGKGITSVGANAALWAMFRHWESHLDEGHPASIIPNDLSDMIEQLGYMQKELMRQLAQKTSPFPV